MTDWLLRVEGIYSWFFDSVPHEVCQDSRINIGSLGIKNRVVKIRFQNQELASRYGGSQVHMKSYLNTRPGYKISVRHFFSNIPRPCSHGRQDQSISTNF